MPRNPLNTVHRSIESASQSLSSSEIALLYSGISDRIQKIIFDEIFPDGLKQESKEIIDNFAKDQKYLTIYGIYCVLKYGITEIIYNKLNSRDDDLAELFMKISSESVMYRINMQIIDAVSDYIFENKEAYNKIPRYDLSLSNKLKEFSMNFGKENININLNELANILKQKTDISSDTMSEIMMHLQQKSESRFASQPHPTRLIPTEAPEKWVDRKPEDKTPGHFIARVYGPWLSQMHTGHIRDRDPTLGRALDRWVEGGKKGEPEEGFHLPSKAEALAGRPRITDEERRHASALLSRDHRAKKRER